MKRASTNSSPCGAASDLFRLAIAISMLAIAASPAVAERQLSWQPLAVEARLDAEGVLWVRESHTMVFTGDWNGGERIFQLGTDQSLELLGISRVDPDSGVEVALVEGSLSLVDQYDWTDRRTLRWRSRLPTDPSFDRTAITYLIEYRQDQVLQPSGDRYRLNHDFAFPDRQWPVESFTLTLELDPIWQPARSLRMSYGPVELPPYAGFLVTTDLSYLGDGAPAGVRQLPAMGVRAAVIFAAALAILGLIVIFIRGEGTLGRFSPPAVPASLDTDWLDEHVFDLLPEEAGALWDRKVGAPEVAAILARWEAEGRIESEVVAKPGMFKRDVLELKLEAERDSFDDYEGKLLGKLFVRGRRRTDTETIRKYYKNRGFDPAATVRRGIERRLGRRGKELLPYKKLRGVGRLVTLGLLFAVLGLMAVEALARPLMTLQLALLLVLPLGVLYLILGLVFAHTFRNRLTNLALWSLGFVVPASLFFTLVVGLVFFERLFPDLDFAPQPGIAGTAAMALLTVMVWSSLLNNARSRERPAGLARRQRLAAARRLFARQLESQQPMLMDRWMPYLLALGLGPRVDRWWRKFGGAAESGSMAASRRFGAGTSGAGGGAWTGGGGAFGGAGATASWAAVAGGIAAGVAKPGSSGSGGGSSGGGGSSSGGGGGGGW